MSTVLEIALGVVMTSLFSPIGFFVLPLPTIVVFILGLAIINFFPDSYFGRKLNQNFVFWNLLLVAIIPMLIFWAVLSYIILSLIGDLTGIIDTDAVGVFLAVTTIAPIAIFSAVYLLVNWVIFRFSYLRYLKLKDSRHGFLLTILRFLATILLVILFCLIAVLVTTRDGWKDFENKSSNMIAFIFDDRNKKENFLVSTIRLGHLSNCELIPPFYSYRQECEEAADVLRSIGSNNNDENKIKNYCGSISNINLQKACVKCALEAGCIRD